MPAKGREAVIRNIAYSSPRHASLRALVGALFFGGLLLVWARTTTWDPVSAAERASLEASLPDRVWLQTEGRELRVSADLYFTAIAPNAGGAGLEDFRAHTMCVAHRSSPPSVEVTGVRVEGPFVTGKFGTEQILWEYDLTGEVTEAAGETWFEAVRR